MDAKRYELARKICLEMGVEWDEDAEYATVDDLELKEYLLKKDIFSFSKRLLITYDENANLYEQDNLNGYMLAA